MPAVEVELIGSKIHLRSAYSPGTAAKCKTVPGAHWDPDSKTWSYPLSMDTCRTLRRVFGDDLIIRRELSKWALEQVQMERKLQEIVAMTDADLPLVRSLAPTMFDAMGARKYQRVGAKFLAEVKRGGNFDRPGLGKSVIGLASIMENGTWETGNHLVIAPATALRATWENEIRRWTDGQPFVADGTLSQRQKTIDQFLAATGPKLLMVNPEMIQIKREEWCPTCDEWVSDLDVRHRESGHKAKWMDRQIKFPELLDIHWDAILADEAHKYMQRCRPHVEKIPQWAHGLLRLKTPEGGLRQAMTGTPMRGRESNFFGMFHWTNPKAFNSYWNWVDTFLIKTDNGYGQVVGGLRPGMEELFYANIDKTFLRRTREEVRADLPEKNLIDVWVEPTATQRKQYNSWAADAIAHLEGGTIEGIGILAEMTRARQFAYGAWKLETRDDKTVMTPTTDSGKLNRVMDMLTDRGIDADNFSSDGSADKIIIVSQFTQILNSIYAHLDKMGIGALMITGEKKRTIDGQLSADMFAKAGGLRILLLNTAAGGVSLTLDAYCDEMIILDETWIYDDIDQVMGRIDNRGGRVAPRFYYFVRTKETIEEMIAETNLSQEELQKELLDRRRGVAMATRLIGGGK